MRASICACPFLFYGMKTTFTALFIISFLHSQTINVPPRTTSMPGGKNFTEVISMLPRIEREEMIFVNVTAGNIPNFLRRLYPISITKEINGTEYTLEYFVTPDYLAVGIDSDYFLSPMTPLLAQKIANHLQCMLPTKTMVDQIYSAARVKLPPQPIPSDTNMTKVPRFIAHNDSVRSLRAPLLFQFPLGSLVAGTKKDIIVHQKVYAELRPNRPKPVVIYGWHKLTGEPIQPPNNWHQETYVDYSHGVRLVQKRGKINGADISLVDILQDETYYILIGDTVLTKPWYETTDD